MFLDKFKDYYCYRVFKSIKERGFIKTIRLIYDEKIFDWLNGIDTSGIKLLGDLDIKYNSKENGFRYEGTNRTAFFNVLDNFYINKEDCTFVDLGCGRGLALILAIRAGFKRVIGVEFSKELSDTADCNLRKFIIKRNFTDVTYNIFNQDVIEFKPPSDNLVFFMCNPFDEKIIRDAFVAYEKFFGVKSSISVIYINALYKKELTSLGYSCETFYESDPLGVYENGMAVLTKIRN